MQNRFHRDERGIKARSRNGQSGQFKWMATWRTKERVWQKNLIPELTVILLQDASRRPFTVEANSSALHQEHKYSLPICHPIPSLSAATCSPEQPNVCHPSPVVSNCSPGGVTATIRSRCRSFIRRISCLTVGSLIISSRLQNWQPFYENTCILASLVERRNLWQREAWSLIDNW